MKRKAKLSIFGSSFVLIIAVVSCIAVCASSYVTTLNIGNGDFVRGTDNYYTAGANQIMIGINSWTNYNNRGYTNLKISLVTGVSGSFTNNVKIMKISSANVSQHEDFGYLTAGARHYEFSTLIDGITYGGVVSDHVVMSS